MQASKAAGAAQEATAAEACVTLAAARLPAVLPDGASPTTPAAALGEAGCVGGATEAEAEAEAVAEEEAAGVGDAAALAVRKAEAERAAEGKAAAKARVVAKGEAVLSAPPAAWVPRVDEGVCVAVGVRVAV